MDRPSGGTWSPTRTLFADGGNTSGQMLNLAARHEDGRWAIVYLGGQAGFSIRMDRFPRGSTVHEFWIDPRWTRAILLRSSCGRPAWVPDAPGWEDAVLVLEASGGS